MGRCGLRELAWLSWRGDFAIGEHDEAGPYRWLEGDEAVTVWSDEGRVLLASGGAIEAGGRRLLRESLVRVVAFVADDFIARGVRAELADGEAVDLLVSWSNEAAAMIGYTRNDLLCDSGWAPAIASALATWAGCAYEDRI